MMDRKQSWMFLVEMIVICGIFLNCSVCESSDTNGSCRLKKILFISNKNYDDTNCHFPSDVLEANRTKLCFNIPKESQQKACCSKGDFNCDYNITYKNNYRLVLKNETLLEQDIVLMQPDQIFPCMPSKFYNKTSGFLLRIHNCLKIGVHCVRLSHKSLLNSSYCGEDGSCIIEKNDNKTTVKDNEMHNGSHVSSKPVLCPEQPGQNHTDAHTGLETALNVFQTASSAFEQMNNCSAANVKKGKVRGMIRKLPDKDQVNIVFGFTSSGISILEDNTDPKPESSLLVHIPKEASEMAVQRNSSYVGVLLVNDVPQNDPSSSLLHNEAVAIDMGVEISNLSQTIDIHYRNVDKNGNIASCRSWDGKRNESIWIKDGCQTKEANGSITCQCSHLTFFAVLLSPPPANISSSDLTSLTYITSIGCGLSIFFLVVAIFLYCLFRKKKATQSTKILMHLFVAMITLNLSFVTNDKIANLGNFGACVAIAALMHYTMLATITWFLMEALHLYFNLRKLASEMKYYMVKICATGWVTPALVVIPLLACGKYGFLVISADDGTSAKMCWIPDAVIHQWVNISYYAIVFIFTFGIFILTVLQIVIIKPKQGKAQGSSCFKTKAVSILGLIMLLGITWGFAFFSHGPLRIASYYIFSILNSFQGFFLFIYYYKSSRPVAEENISNTYATSLEQ